MTDVLLGRTRCPTLHQGYEGLAKTAVSRLSTTVKEPDSGLGSPIVDGQEISAVAGRRSGGQLVGGLVSPPAACDPAAGGVLPLSGAAPLSAGSSGDPSGGGAPSSVGGGRPIRVRGREAPSTAATGSQIVKVEPTPTFDWS